MDKINGFLNDTEVSEVEYGGMEVPFPNIAGIISIFWWFFQILLISLKDSQYFSVSEIKLWLFDWLSGVFFF